MTALIRLTARLLNWLINSGDRPTSRGILSLLELLPKSMFPSPKLSVTGVTLRQKGHLYRWSSSITSIRCLVRSSGSLSRRYPTCLMQASQGAVWTTCTTVCSSRRAFSARTQRRSTTGRRSMVLLGTRLIAPCSSWWRPSSCKVQEWQRLQQRWLQASSQALLL